MRNEQIVFQATNQALGFRLEPWGRFYQITHNTLLSVLEKGSHWQKALQHFKGVEPDLISFNSIISAGEKGDQWPLSADLYCQLRFNNLEADVISGSATLSAYEKGSAWQNALLLLALPRHPLNVVSWNAAISASEKEGEWEWALLLLGSMAGAQPDVISFNAVISACERASQWEVALLLFNEASDVDHVDHISINALLGALARAAQWSLALRISMTQNLDVIGANAVVRACAAGSQWRWATQLLQELRESDRLEANAVSYAAALLAYQAMMQWLIASHLLQANRQHAMAAQSGVHGVQQRGWLEPRVLPVERRVERLERLQRPDPRAAPQREDVVGRQINDFIKARLGSSQPQVAPAVVRTLSPVRQVLHPKSVPAGVVTAWHYPGQRVLTNYQAPVAVAREAGAVAGRARSTEPQRGRCLNATAPEPRTFLSHAAAAPSAPSSGPSRALSATVLTRGPAAHVVMALPQAFHQPSPAPQKTVMTTVGGKSVACPS
eukprot:s167_g30.t1